MVDYTKNPRFKYFFTIVLIVSIGVMGGFTVLAFQPISIPLEVKEAIEILDYPSSGFSLFAGENITFEITVQNLASVTHFVEFDFQLNDTDYQTKYVTFSNYNYSVPTGTQTLSAWVKIAQTAPPANLMLTINRKTDTQSPSSFPTTSSNSSLTLSPTNSSLLLFGGGARWASPEGNKALFINRKDNWKTHHLTDGADWGPWHTEELMDEWRAMTTSALEAEGFEVTFAGDVPEDLNIYDLVVFQSPWSVEPQHSDLVRDYLSNGGGVVIRGSPPCHFAVYCKDRWPYRFGGTDLSSIQDWFGASRYANTNGEAMLVVDDPFGTQLADNEMIFSGDLSRSGVTDLDDDAEVIAMWESGIVFAFTHEYNGGRVYYQAEIPVYR